MGRTRAWLAALAATLLLSHLSACSSTSEPGMHHGHLDQPPTTQGPFCGDKHPFGELKGGEIERAVALKASEPLAIALDDHPSDAGKLLTLAHPLDPLPPEIARIRRGLVKRFTGRFVRDGEIAWSGVDLDRLVAVSVERRVFDFRAHLSRAVSDPVFGQSEQLSFARKWTDGHRTEIEVVNVFPIVLPEAQLVVCAANPVWADRKPLPDQEDPSGDLSDGVTDVFLLDYRQEQNVSYKYSKTVYLTENLANILGSIWQHAPRGPSW